MFSSGAAFIQASKDCSSPYLSESTRDLNLLKSFAYGFGILFTSCKLTEIFIQYTNELNVIKNPCKLLDCNLYYY